jgi:prevent-host-death family protein
MRSISATDAKQRLAALLDAVQREPIMIRRHDRDVAVLISAEEYERMQSGRVEEFQRFCDRVGAAALERGMNEAALRALLADDAS